MIQALPFSSGRCRIVSSIRLLLALGGFLIVQTALLSQEDLELPVAPLHLALVGLQSALILSNLRAGGSVIEALGIMALSSIFTLGLGSLYRGEFVFWLGSAVLLALCARAELFRALGRKPEGKREEGCLA